MVLFNLMFLFWVALFPWYLAIRARIIAGTLPRKALASGKVPAKSQQSVISSRRR
jgi:hypothetical protein